MRSRKPSQHVLVVEDDPELRELYRSTLTSAGYPVVAVEDGLDALRRIFTGEIPRAVVLDMALPRLGGRGVHQELASHPATRHIPIVVVSGTDTRDLDPDDFACMLRKPIAPQELLEALESCLA